ncbi:dipeptide ABC transporter ATP-binding protein [Sporosarcina thermotolerans]|uniref:Dipeptide ABC transporter ATP-binding protein n=1 Tax=Sporosarcina thermotolerans TaxID=633404 RepID=A0AAW9A4J5_9BACL|nr:dipeptide ABC transporter ATP-binding protein [Sporosarcina thermotolerans]MDW0116221.1 dipeptide ABC transporter ATP-binding protein [Sporosarcina thermotolerans]WHT48191.1 dipeptide ABC transporter ATP-binding protein [Sporosarcina thermotolerans]
MTYLYDEDNVLLEVNNLKQYFPIKGGIFGRTVNHVKAVDGISFKINEGETVSLVGESGCGKSTTGRSILRLEMATDGEVLFRNSNLLRKSKKEMRLIRKDIQAIFQDPYASLNPRQKIGETLEEAMRLLNVVPKNERKERAIELLEQVGMRKEHIDRYPHEFSGGQRQRIGIARALAVEPKLIICDEAVSALDVSVQAQVLNLLKHLQKVYGLTYLFISHDLAVVRHISDRIIVMYLGKIVETASKKTLFDKPNHPYTRALLSAIPETNRALKRERIILQGDIPSPIDPPTGCRFQTRCPFAQEICRTTEPPLLEIATDHQSACHFSSDFM